jgi:hypothetical protein
MLKIKSLKQITFLLLSLSFLFACNSNHKNDNTSRINEESQLYLGQKKPGLVPVRFAPNMVSTKYYEYGGTFTPDLKEFYFIREGGKYKKSKLVVFKLENNQWKESVVSERVGQPVISPNGQIMHLGRRYKTRIKDGWSELKELNAPFSNLRIMRLSSSKNGTYYFDTYDKDKPDFPIRYSRKLNGKYQHPQTLDENINSGIKNFNHPFIAPDESYIIWDAVKEEGFGSSDIYISFRQKDNTWGKAINLGNKINTSAWEASASVTPDGNYLFFNRNMGSDNYEDVDIFWVDASIIRDLKNNYK